VLEKKPHLGGRAYSFIDPDAKQTVDNGQHLFMGCYRSTRRFLEEIGTSSLLHFADKIRVDYADASGGRDVLSCPSIWARRSISLGACSVLKPRVRR